MVGGGIVRRIRVMTKEDDGEVRPRFCFRFSRARVRVTLSVPRFGVGVKMGWSDGWS